MHYVFAGIAVHWSSDDEDAPRALHLCLALTDVEVLSVRVPSWRSSTPHHSNRHTHEGQTCSSIDDSTAAWMCERFPIGTVLVPVCWNREAVDLPTVRSRLPNFGALLGHRLIQLDEVCRRMEGTAAYLDAMPRAAQWKQMAQTMSHDERYLNCTLCPDTSPVLDEAVTCVLAWKWLHAIAGRRLLSHAELRAPAHDSPIEIL